MVFDIDVFISYAHLDNRPLTPEAMGWVSEFHEALSTRLGEVLGKAPRIWRDPKLQGNDDFGEEIEQRVKGCAVLVSVITPRYIVSDSCRRELTDFLSASGDTGGTMVGSKARVFKVLKTPVQASMPPPLESLLGYEFYRIQPGNGRPLEFNRIYGKHAERDFWVRLNDLAYDLADLLTRLESQAAGEAEDRTVVYLATTTSDLQSERDAMRRELQRHGHEVLPQDELPLVAPVLEAAVALQLQRAALSIHLLGASYGVVPEGAVESLPAIQARLAAERARAGGLVRLAWIPGREPCTDQRQRQLLDSLRDDPVPSPGSDLLDGRFEDLKALALARLAAQAAARSRPADAGIVIPPHVYIVCDEVDLAAASGPQRYLFDQGFEVSLPLFEGEERERQDDHAAQLRSCDALLIHYGSAGEAWLRRRLAELRELRQRAPSDRLLAALILLAPPLTPAKDRLLTRDADVSHLAGDNLQAALAPLVARLRGPADAVR